MAEVGKEMGVDKAREECTELLEVEDIEVVLGMMSERSRHAPRPWSMRIS